MTHLFTTESAARRVSAEPEGRLDGTTGTVLYITGPGGGYDNGAFGVSLSRGESLALARALGGADPEPEPEPELDGLQPLRDAGLDPARAIALTVARSLFPDYAVEDTILAADFILGPVEPVADVTTGPSSTTVTPGTPCDRLTFSYEDADGDRLAVEELEDGTVAFSTTQQTWLPREAVEQLVAFLGRSR